MTRKGVPKVPPELFYPYPAVPTPGDLFLSNTDKELVNRILIDIIEGIDGERRKGLGPGFVYGIAEDMWNKPVVEEVTRQLGFGGWKTELHDRNLVISAA